MVIKTEEARWLPPLEALQRSGANQHGWIILGTGRDSTTWEIINIHHYSDYGVMLETFTIQSGKEQKDIYSYDEGETFTFDCW